MDDPRGFAVVIPYFQRDRGVLSRTLASIAGQRFDHPVIIYVVDDQSPLPPAAEVAAVDFPAAMRVVTLTQANGGPGAARNRALDAAAAEGCARVAFLDSDDIWAVDHLARAASAFDHGHDVYLADTAFEDGTRLRRRFYADRLPAAAIEGAGTTLATPLIDQVIDGPLGRLSAAAATMALIGTTRFDPALRTAGEDGLFWCALAAKRPRVWLDGGLGSTAGHGVNIFTEGAWNDLRGLTRACHLLAARLQMRRFAPPGGVAAARLARLIATSRTAIWRSTLANLKHGRWRALAMLANTARADPAILAALPNLLLGGATTERRP